MVTTNLKNLIALIFCSRSSGGDGLLPVKDTTGTTYYASAYFGTGYFPYNANTSVSNSMSNVGIGFGSGQRSEDSGDYALQTPITSGLSGTVVVSTYMDSNSPRLQYDITLTNTSQDSLYITEVCYKQNIYVTTAQGSSSGSTSKVCMLDRTLLEVPITLLAGEAATIRYTLGSTVASDITAALDEVVEP